MTGQAGDLDPKQRVLGKLASEYSSCLRSFASINVWACSEALARQLQGEEDEAARMRYEQRNRYEQRARDREEHSSGGHPHGAGQGYAGDLANSRGRSWQPAAQGERKEKKKKDCIIM